MASTNAIISAVCVNEAIKLLTFAGQTLNNYYMYMGAQGLYSPTFEYQRKDNCVVCSDSSAAINMTINGSMTLQEFLAQLCNDVNFQLIKPSIISDEKSLYMQKPPSLEQQLRKNLSIAMKDLITDGETVTVTDPTLNDISLTLVLQFQLLV